MDSFKPYIYLEYSDNDIGIEHRSDWIVMPKSSNSTSNSSTITNYLVSPNGNYIYFLTKDISKDTSLDQYINLRINQLNNTLPYAKIHNLRTVSYGLRTGSFYKDENTRTLEYNVKVNNSALHILEEIALKPDNGRAYVITYVAPSNEYANDLKAVEDMMGSLLILSRGNGSIVPFVAPLVLVALVCSSIIFVVARSILRRKPI
jgi:hypothetical protein